MTGALESNGTTILDVSNPRQPRVIKHIPGVEGAESRAVQVVEKYFDGRDYLLRNQESSQFTGFEIWDITGRSSPKLVSKIERLNAAHKGWWDARTGYAYLSGIEPGWKGQHLKRDGDFRWPTSASTGALRSSPRAARGLGREYALELARRGAKVVVNDFGGARDGAGGSTEAAEAVVAEIRAFGGEAFAHGTSVTDVEGVADMVAQAMGRWGRIDILIANAGVLRDKTFAKMEIEDFRFVLEVHLMGAVIPAKAVWEIMRAQNYGRIVVTTSSSGLYGNFGQSNYGAAKMGLVGLMQTLKLEGAKTTCASTPSPRWPPRA